jgi:hypothetical protein
MTSHDDLSTRRIAWIGAAIAGVVAGVVGFVLLWLPSRGMPLDGQTEGRRTLETVPGPALQSAPQPDLAAYRAEKERLLHRREWVDAAHGIVRIPIEDAMAVLAAEGVAAGAASAAGAAR